MSKHPYEGPMTVSPVQRSLAVALSNSVFRAKGGGDMGAQFPLLFHPDRLEQVRIFADNAGRPVSMVGMAVDDVSLLGCPVRMACIGSVCTAEPARGRGLAGALVDDAIERAAREGVLVILVSGHRSLYLRRGWTSAGRFLRYHLPPESLAGGEGVEISEVAPEDCEEALSLHEREPVHFQRTPDDYAAQVRCGWTINRPGRTYLVRRSGRAVAVASANRAGPRDREEGPVLGIAEMAGSRAAILGALEAIRSDFCPDAARVVIDAYPGDRDLADACRQRGARAEVVAHVGAVKVLDPARLWQALLPALRERIGPAADRIRVHTEGDRLAIATLTFEMDGQRIPLTGNRRAVTALFDAPEEAPPPNAAGPLAEALARALPLPLPLYGLNYA